MRFYGTSGRAVPGYDLKIVDPGGEPVADGDEGALWVRGPSACAGYWNQRAKSLSTFHGPWTRTGDRYTRDAEGRYTYGGRADDMLKVGGIWVSPFEVESALGAYEAVLEAAVVGHPDEQGLVKPRAFVVCKTPSGGTDALAAELKGFVKERLAPYEVPAVDRLSSPSCRRRRPGRSSGTSCGADERRAPRRRGAPSRLEVALAWAAA